MRFSTIFVAAALAFGISAMPNAQDSTYGTPGKDSGSSTVITCPNNMQSVCCAGTAASSGSGGLLGLGAAAPLTCVVSALGDTCSSQQLCCQNIGTGSQTCHTQKTSGVLNNANIPVNVHDVNVL